MAFFNAYIKTGNYLLLLGIFVCILAAVMFPFCAMAQASSAITEQTCLIHGKVIDSYGTYVPGAEVRLLMPGGEFCGIPDNPALSSACMLDDEGTFEFRDVPLGKYLLTAVKDQSNGSISISLHEGNNYVEITLARYVNTRLAYDSIGPPLLLIATTLPVSASPELTISQASDVEISETKPNILRVFLSGFIVLTGAFLATIVLKKR